MLPGEGRIRGHEGRAGLSRQGKGEGFQEEEAHVQISEMTQSMVRSGDLKKPHFAGTMHKPDSGVVQADSTERAPKCYQLLLLLVKMSQNPKTRWQVTRTSNVGTEEGKGLQEALDSRPLVPVLPTVWSTRCPASAPSPESRWEMLGSSPSRLQQTPDQPQSLMSQAPEQEDLGMGAAGGH